MERKRFTLLHFVLRFLPSRYIFLGRDGCAGIAIKRQYLIP